MKVIKPTIYLLMVEELVLHYLALCLCSEYNTANYCPVLLLKISIRTFGAYALCNCLHSPWDKAKKSSVHTFQQKSAHLEKNIIIRLYSQQLSSLSDMPFGKR